MAHENVDEDAPLFAIAVAADLATMHPQTLRQYDRIGLVIPGRTRGGSRRYSMRNIAQLRQVAQMSQDGMSLPAIAHILRLEETVHTLRKQVTDLESQLRVERDQRPGSRVFAAGATGSIVTLRAGTRIRRETGLELWSPPGQRRSDDA
ncbi:helix-turn-helix transcriptional regulator [Microbacterium mitrae]|uniref:MerR family transcriptional regulator n=1 Tax=Microbacterium mitrae TaxID=664640 RepID=A0A5C8HKU6_9MICO|nr:MerR family transcriptional regulator [Microbacterium mitrae]TXK04040.1 MerR family transcriptional regulator [Microbacterium mitrae]